MLIASILAFSILWSVAAPGVLYYCSDDVPIMAFIPPFVHAPTEQTNDRYLVSPVLVYCIWSGFLIAAAVSPALLLRRVGHGVETK
ncbi:MAG: hypothetical protein AB1705_04755 [Verrucomicrobiota bacterium]